MEFMEFFKTLVYGIVEGITEWLPVSSTGHLILLQKYLPLDASLEFYDVFRIVIQFGAILAVLVAFCTKLWPFSIRDEQHVDKDILSLWGKIGVACLPAAIVGLAFEKKLEELFYKPIVVALSLIIVGILFIIAEIKLKDKDAKMEEVTEITYKTAAIIGLFQLVAAIFPGVSRSGATIIGALILGVSRKAATEFTFYLAVPVMFGASLIKIMQSGMNFRSDENAFIVLGFMSAYFVSLLMVKVLINYVKNHDFKAFAIYRIVLGVVVIATLVIGV